MWQALIRSGGLFKELVGCPHDFQGQHGGEDMCRSAGLFSHKHRPDFEKTILKRSKIPLHLLQGAIPPVDGPAVHLQPPYSPELNPAERVWEHLREKATPNKAFKSLDQLQEALCSHLRELENAPEKLRSMTDFPYMRVL